MNKPTITTFAAFAAACFAGSSAFAGTPVQVSKQPKEVLQESCITGDIGLDITSNYISKGIVWENQGLILAPYANLHFRFAEKVGVIDSITADIGFQSVYTDNRTNAGFGPIGGGPGGGGPGGGGPGGGGPGGGGSTSNWLEFNFTAGLTFDINKLSISPYYKVYQSPSDVFPNTYATGIRLAYDDKDLFGAWSLNPYVLVELQLQESRGNNNPVAAPLGFNGRGQYYEVGLTPSHSYGNLTVSLPLRGGFGTGGFYLGNRGFGFFSVGIGADYMLPCIPACLGKWSLHSGFNYVVLGGNNSFPGASGAAGFGPAFTPVGVANDNNQFVFNGGLKVAF